MQLEILDAAKKLQRTATARDHAAGQSRAVLWAMMGESFWLERDLSRLASMIEELLVVLERLDAVFHGESADP